MRILLSTGMVAQAAYYNRAVLETDNVQNNPNYTGFSTPSRFFDGELGELAFGHYLWQEHIKHERCNNMEGHPDHGDFRIDGKVINVKNTLHPEGRMLMMPVEQFERHDADYYVGCKTVLFPAGHGICSIYGWISSEKFAEKAERVDLKCPTMQFQLHLLDPMDFSF